MMYVHVISPASIPGSAGLSSAMRARAAPFARCHDGLTGSDARGSAWAVALSIGADAGREGVRCGVAGRIDDGRPMGEVPPLRVADTGQAETASAWMASRRAALVAMATRSCSWFCSSLRTAGSGTVAKSASAEATVASTVCGTSPRASVAHSAPGSCCSVLQSQGMGDDAAEQEPAGDVGREEASGGAGVVVGEAAREENGEVPRLPLSTQASPVSCTTPLKRKVSSLGRAPRRHTKLPLP